jgi:hypothetical protein
MPLHPFTSFDASTGRPTLVDAEEITFTAEQTRLFFRPHREEGLGNLYVTNQSGQRARQRDNEEGV